MNDRHDTVTQMEGVELRDATGKRVKVDLPLDEDWLASLEGVDVLVVEDA